MKKAPIQPTLHTDFAKKKRLTSENMLISGRSPRSFCSTLENSNLQGIFESSDSVWCFPFNYMFFEYLGQ